MEIKQNHYYITDKKYFQPQDFTSTDYVEKAFDFAWNMTFGMNGRHRDHRTGGQTNRKNGEIFINTFQGKLAEFAVYQKLKYSGINAPYPDLEQYQLGRWDISDFKINNINIAVKSTKFYGNLLLLETGDWDNYARYIPSNVTYDYLILVRIKPDGEAIMKQNKLLYSNTCAYDTLKKIILSEVWTFDIAGFITKDELKDVISKQQIIPQNAMLNTYTKMDAENYFVEAGKMNSFNLLCTNLRLKY